MLLVEKISGEYIFLMMNSFYTCRKRRKLFAMKKQARERMHVGGGATADSEDAELFSLNNIKSKKVTSTKILTPGGCCGVWLPKILPTFNPRPPTLILLILL